MIYKLTAALIAIILTSCGGGGVSLPEGGDTLTHHATLLTLIDHGDGIMSARIRDPWNAGGTLATYILVDKNVPEDKVPYVEGAVTVRVPVEKAVVYSSVHCDALMELGMGKVIGGVADARYFRQPLVRDGVKSGRIKDVGSNMSPMLDVIMDMDPDVILLSPYQNSGHGALDKSGIAIIEMADYMEPSPKARAEWIKLLGAMTGRMDKSNAIFEQVCQQYDSLSTMASNTNNAPKVLCEMPYNGVWYQPGGGSYIAQMIRDAGGVPLYDKDTTAGSLQLDIASVYDAGADADVWLIKSDDETSMWQIASTLPLARDIKAYRQGNVWHANTMLVPYYDHLAFHPERILRDMVVIFNPQLVDTLGIPGYFSPVR